MDYIAALNRKAIMEIQQLNPSLADIKFENNSLRYGDVVINLGDFNLMSLLGDYSSLRTDIELLSSEDLMNIVGVNVLGSTQLDEDKPTIRSIFYQELDGTNKTYDGDKVVKSYDSFLYDLMCHQDYLAEDIRPLLDEYAQKMEVIQVFPEEATERAQNELTTYHMMQEKAHEFALRFQKEKQMKLELKRPQEKAGYVNAFGIVLTIMLLGITIASLLLINLW